jgi:hypothetical protein
MSHQRAVVVAAFLLGAAWQTNASTQDTAQAEVTERDVQQVLQAKNSLTAGDAYRALFRRAGTEGLRDLQNSKHDGIALRAAWDEVRLTAEGKEPQVRVPVDAGRMHRFLGFVQGRLGVTPPRWWEEVVLSAWADHRDNYFYFPQPKDRVYHPASVNGLQAPRDTTLSERNGRMFVRLGQASAEVTAALPSDPTKRGGDCVSACLAPAACYVAVHHSRHTPYLLYGLARDSGKVL